MVNIPEEIKDLFVKRDTAVTKQDRPLFLSTQIAEIDNGSSNGYLAIGKMESEILYVYPENELEKIVFVKEIYTPIGKDFYSSFLVYYLVHTVKGWKIYRVK